MGVLRFSLETGLPAKYLKLEVTESVVMHDSRSIVPVLEELRDLGAIIAMDDFGTGYSSLASLHRFPIDVLKIDQAFIRGMATCRRHSAIVYTIVTLAEQLDIGVVADGVETEDHLVQLQAMDCAAAQGCLFSRPVPASEAEPMLGKSRLFARAA